MAKALNIRTPLGAKVGAPDAGPASISAENAFLTAQRTNEGIQREQIRAADKIVNEKVKQAQLGYYQSTLNGVDNPSDYMDTLQKASAYYEATGRGDKAALSEQRAFLAQERYLRGLERQSKEGGDGTSGLGVNIDDNEFIGGFNMLNAAIENLDDAANNGLIDDPREFMAAYEELWREKDKLIEDFVISDKDKSSMRSSENFWGNRDMAFDEKGKLFLANPSPFEQELTVDHKSRFNGYKELSNNQFDDLVFVQNQQSNGVLNWDVVTKSSLNEQSGIHIPYMTYYENPQVNDETGETEITQSITPMGSRYYKAFLKKDANNQPIGLRLHEKDGEERWIRFDENSMQDLLAAHQSQEITDDQLLGIIEDPSKGVKDGYIDEGVTLGNLISDPRVASSWLDGSNESTGRWFGEPVERHNQRNEEEKNLLLQGKAHVDENGQLLMHDELPSFGQDEAEDAVIQQEIQGNPWFDNEAWKSKVARDTEEEADAAGLQGEQRERWINQRMEARTKTGAPFGWLKKTQGAIESVTPQGPKQHAAAIAAGPALFAAGKGAASAAEKFDLPVHLPASVQNILGKLGSGVEAVKEGVATSAKKGAAREHQEAIAQGRPIVGGSRALDAFGGGIKGIVRDAFAAARSGRETFQTLLGGFRR